MRRLLLVLGTIAFSVLSVPDVFAQSEAGQNRFPRTDAESRSVRTNLPRPVRITRRHLPGDVLTRGRAMMRNRGGRATQDCEFDFGVEVSLYSGSREYTIETRPDCSVVLQNLNDNDVVEPEDRIVAAQTPGAFGRIRDVAGRLWDALFPTAFAQSYALKTIYHHIYTCGIACAGGIDGLTAQQGWLYYRHNGISAQMDGAWGWFCTSGMNGSYSWCQPPMEVPGAPMNQINTGWAGYNSWIMYRYWGPGTNVSAGDQTMFDWRPIGFPPTFIHTLYNERKANQYGVASCISYYSGYIVNGPVIGNCVQTSR
jgi:hypothetical protein